MNARRPSKTADQVALSRAIESAEPDHLRGCNDPLARSVTSTLEAFGARFARWSARPAGANLRVEVSARSV